MNATLLVEILTEELPPKALQSLGQAFGNSLFNSLQHSQHIGSSESTTELATTAPPALEIFASPRRLACRIAHVRALSPAQTVRERLLPVAIGLNPQGQASPPLLKKLQSLGVDTTDPDLLGSLLREHDGKQEVLWLQRQVQGVPLAQAVQQALLQATSTLPIPKLMSYQRPDASSSIGNTVHFVRPAHSLLVLHGDTVLPVQVLGLEAGRSTHGHRFMHPGPLHLDHANDYDHVLRTQGKVIANFAERRQAIVEGLAHKAQGDVVVQPDALLDEVCALVEWPVVYEGQFEPEFLQVPQECLMLTMQANQKYFAITNPAGKLTPRFLLVSNLYTATPEAIVQGNERVLRARLADAQFFFEQDRKRTLASRVPQLAQVVYHNKLGNQLQRNQRIVALAMHLAPACGANPDQVQQAALWCKADLLTDMVGEFPELQGTMGQYYAQHDGASPAVAQAIADHYQPRFAGDALPRGPVGLALALADKLETLVGMFGIDLAPTGDKDPFALRRHALGVARILIERQCPLKLQSTLQYAESLFTDCKAFSPRSAALYTFMQDRLRSHLAAEDHTPQAIEAVLASNPAHWADLPARLEAVRAFSALPEAQALAAANKRIHNILKKTEQPRTDALDGHAINTSLLCEPAEIALAQTLATLGPVAQTAYQEQRYSQALQTLAAFKTPVDNFFAEVMVMDNNPALRNNRLCLLGQLHALMNHIADLAQLSTPT